MILFRLKVKYFSLIQIINSKKIILCHTFLFLIFGISYNLYAQQNLKQQLEYADSLFKSEKYFDAITEYKRLRFFDETSEYEYAANYKIALCYKMGAKFDNAIKYFSLSVLNAKNNNDSIKSKFQIIRCNILRKTTQNALLLLNKYDAEPEFENSLHKINYWKGWAYMFSDDFKKAEYYFNKSGFGTELKKILNNAEKQKYSVTFAKVISFILPGAGQFYSGNYLSGFVSLGWNLLWGYITVNAFAADRAFDGLAVGSLLWLRFYKGNIQNSNNFALQKNMRITNSTLEQIQNNYKGIKP